jgi:hypothetical protein
MDKLREDEPPVFINAKSPEKKSSVLLNKNVSSY